MEKLTMCRICLAENVRMQLIRETHLHKMYEALTTMPFVTEDSRPLQVCYICCARLQSCYKLKMRCLQSEELFSQMLNNEVELTRGLSKQELSTVQVVQMSFDDVVRSPKLCYEVKVEYEHPEATTSDIVEDTDKDENFQFSNIEEQEMIDIIKYEPGEQTSAPVPKQPAQTNVALSNFMKLEKSGYLIEALKTHTEIALQDNILQTRNERDQDVNKLNKGNNVSDQNNVENGIFGGIALINLQPFSCEVCRKSFNRKCNYEKHIRKHTSDMPLQCNVCKKCFTVKRNLDVHIRTHTGEKPYQCNMCKKCFSEKGKLVKHIRTHTGEKPYKCNLCKKCFSQRTDLVRHIRAHNGEKPYECNVCKKCFSQKTDLVRHIRTHTGEKPYQCNSCEKRFTQKGTLDTHMRTHTGEKPHECNICKKSFVKKGDLKKHIDIHTGEKPYQCTICEKFFTQKCSLNTHMHTHTGEKPHQCNVCKKCFSRKGILKRHIRKHTGEILS